MPALDYLNKTTLTLVDVSNNPGLRHPSAAVEMARAGLVKGQRFTVVVDNTNPSDANFNTRTLTFEFEYSTDNGTTYRRAGAASAKVITDGRVPGQVVQGSCDMDIVVEQNDPAHIQWRVAAVLSSNLNAANDFNFTAYLGAETGFPGIVD